MDMEQCKKFDEIMDLLENREDGSSGKFGPFLLTIENCNTSQENLKFN